MINNKSSICYPNPSFTPEIRVINGIEFAHAAHTPCWVSKEGDVLVEDSLGFLSPRKVNMYVCKLYGTKTRNGQWRGRTYPYVEVRRKTYRLHRLMAIAWIGPIRAGYQVDHKNGDIYNWSLENIRIVTVAENCRCAVILRWLRKKGIDPRYLTGLQAMIAFSVVPLWDNLRRATISQQELLVILTSYTIVNPDDQMEYEMTHHMEI